MELQKPLAHHPTTDGIAESLSDSSQQTHGWARVLEMVINCLTPPQWAITIFVSLSVVFFAPRLLTNWLNSLRDLLLFIQRRKRN
ncbi:hypothetical protein V8F06_012957 [Rhypophila decipiens]